MRRIRFEEEEVELGDTVVCPSGYRGRVVVLQGEWADVLLTPPVPDVAPIVTYRRVELRKARV